MTYSAEMSVLNMKHHINKPVTCTQLYELKDENTFNYTAT